MDDGGRYVRGVERRGDVLGMRDGGAEHHSGRSPAFSRQCRITSSVTGARFMMSATSDHVEIRGGLADRAQLVLHADVDDEGARRHEMA